MTALTHHFARALEQLDGMRSLEKEYAQLSSLKEKLEKSLEKANAKVSQMEKASSDSSDQIASLVSQLTEARTALDKRLQQRTKREAEHSEQMASLASQLTEARTALDVVTQKLNEVHKRWMSALDDLQRLEDDNTRQVSEIMHLTSWLQVSEGQKDAATKQVKKLTPMLEQHNVNVQQQKIDNHRRDTEIAELTAAFLSAEERLKTSSVTNSTLVHKRSARNVMKQIQASEFFDSKWYLQRYPDVANSKLTAVEHFLKFGGIEGRDPSAAFSTTAYFEKYPDVRALRLNPLAHYLLEGRLQGCKVTPVDAG